MRLFTTPSIAPKQRSRVTAGIIAILATIAAVLTFTATTVAPAGAATVACASGWTGNSYSHSITADGTIPLTSVTIAKVNYTLTVPYCARWGAAPDAAKMFPGGLKVTQAVTTTNVVPGAKMKISNQRTSPTTLTKTYCNVPTSPGLSTPCYKIKTHTTFVLTMSGCVKFCFSRDVSFDASATFDVSTSHGAWYESMSLKKI